MTRCTSIATLLSTALLFFGAFELRSLKAEEVPVDLKTKPAKNKTDQKEAWYEARTAASEGNYAKAAELYQRLVREHPKSPNVAHWRWHAAYARERESRVAETKLLKEVLRHHPNTRYAGWARKRLLEVQDLTFSRQLNKQLIPGGISKYRPADYQLERDFRIRRIDPTKLADHVLRYGHHWDDVRHRGTVDKIAPELFYFEKVRFIFNTPPLRLPGVYFVDEIIEGVSKRTHLRVLGFRMDVRTLGRDAWIRVSDLASSAPLNDAKVEVRSLKTHYDVQKVEPGLYHARITPGEDIVFAATRGDEVQAVRTSTEPVAANDIVFLTTDRPIYRPGQEVAIKAVLRARTEKGELGLSKREKVRLEIHDSRGRTIHSELLNWNDRGSTSTRFRLPEEGSPGQHVVSVDIGGAPETYYDAFESEIE
ncbi:MAG: MG2 domain-containing protein, partial [Planctomycetota bacterium]